MKVVFSFDTEDFVTPASDGVIRELAEILTRHGAVGSFAMTGDKARSLWTRGRKDVIDAVKRHEVQYHANTHLMFPRTTLMLTKMEWDEGLDFVVDTERHGMECVSEVFGQRPVAWVRCGGNWDPRELYGMNLLGIRLHLPSRCVLPPNGQPLWYANVLQAQYDYFMERYFRPGKTLEDARRDFRATAEKCARTTLPVVAMAHPCMYSTPIFFDTYNARRQGIFPPKHRWVPAPVNSPCEIRRRLATFEEIVKFITSVPGVQIVPESDILKSHDEGSRWVTLAQLRRAAAGLRADFNYQRIGAGYVSLADLFGMLSLALETWRTTGALPARVPVRRVLGPPEPVRALAAPFRAPVAAVAGACTLIEREIDQQHRLPSFARMGGRKVPPSTFLMAMTEALDLIAASGKGPVTLKPQPPYPRCLPEVFPEIHVGTSEAPKNTPPGTIVKYTHQQTWTLRPAVAVGKAAESE